MALLRRRREEPAGHPVTGFWQWWRDEGEQRTTAAVASGDYGNLPDVITDKVHAMHPDLVWELAAGTRARHALIVSAGGIAEVRPLAERWRRAAPSEGPTWEFHPARRADPAAAGQRLDIAGTTLALDDVRFGLAIDDDRQRVDVSVFHPAFAGMPGNTPRQVTFLVLDWLLGEDDVERWLGGIEPVTTPQPGDAAALVEIVEGFRNDDRSENWALLQGTTDAGERILVSARPFLRWIDRPTLDLHHAVTLAFTPVRADGLPEPDALDALRVVEDDLEAAVGDRGELVAVETSTGRRTWHVYTDAEDQNVTDLVAGFAATRGATHTATADAAWRHVRQYQ